MFLLRSKTWQTLRPSRSAATVSQSLHCIILYSRCYVETFDLRSRSLQCFTSQRYFVTVFLVLSGHYQVWQTEAVLSYRLHQRYRQRISHRKIQRGRENRRERKSAWQGLTETPGSRCKFISHLTDRYVINFINPVAWMTPGLLETL